METAQPTPSTAERVLLINPFTVFDGHEDAFFELWDQTSAIFRAKPGYLSARLVRALADQPPGLRAPYTHINVSEWKSAASYATALKDPELKKLGPAYARVCTFRPALYQVLRDV